MKKISTFIIAVLCIGVVVAAGIGTYKYLDKKNTDTNEQDKKPKEKEPENPSNPPKEYTETDYNIKLIKTVNSTQEGNYLISPYSIEIALNMLKAGAKENTLKEIEDVVGTRDITIFNVKDRISVTNGAFIKDSYKESIEKSFYDKLASFDADLVFDKFTTPDKINDWVKEHTYGMIPKILDEISADFVMGLANAVAIDVEWESQFECVNTRSEEFTKSDGKKIDVEMMHKTYEGGNTKYFETEDAKGVVIPYSSYDKDGKDEYDSKESEFTQLEFVGILPNGTVDEYIEGLTNDKLTKFDEKVTTTKESNIKVSLPRFAYSFKLQSFMDVLIAMGIKDAFDADAANFDGIIDRGGLYVSTAIHQTYIDLNEKGTKAAAVTYFGMDKNAMPQQKDVKKIEFNKPFIYMIRDTKTKEILFFGVVEKPNAWKGSTCSNKEE